MYYLYIKTFTALKHNSIRSDRSNYRESTVGDFPREILTLIIDSMVYIRNSIEDDKLCSPFETFCYHNGQKLKKFTHYNNMNLILENILFLFFSNE